MSESVLNEKIIYCQSLTKIFKGIDSNINLVVLKAIDLVIPRFSLTGILGPSGSGKTTLLNILSAITPFEGGKVVIDGISLNDLKNRERIPFWREKISLICQFPEENLFMDVTVSDNLKLSASKFLNRNTSQKLIQSTLKTVNLADYGKSLVKNLSGGELQRLAIAIALIRKTPIILVDEPTGELDLKNSLKIFKLFRDLTHSNDFTCVIVSHDPNLIKFCDQVYFLSSGVLSRM